MTDSSDYDFAEEKGQWYTLMNQSFYDTVLHL